MLRQRRYRVDHLYALEGWDHNVETEINVPLTLVTPKELGRISQLTTPNQVLAVVDLPEPDGSLPDDLDRGWSLYLDGIQSPSNLGALLRIADWFGFERVFGGPGTADLYSSKSVQASMGSFLRVDYREAELGEVVAAGPELPVFGADLSGESIYNLDPPPAGILVIGSEGPGIRPDTRERVTRWLTIPPAPNRQAESLNAAVAAGILCSALRRP